MINIWYNIIWYFFLKMEKNEYYYIYDNIHYKYYKNIKLNLG